MNSKCSSYTFITDSRVYMAVQVADEMAAKDLDVSAYDCAEQAVRIVFGRWFLDHTASVRSELLPSYIRLVDRVEQKLGLHRRRRSRVLPTEPAIGEVVMGAKIDAGRMPVSIPTVV
jgi:hypothetical protein